MNGENRGRVFDFSKVYRYKSGDSAKQIVAWLNDEQSYLKEVPADKFINSEIQRRISSNFRMEQPGISVSDAINAYLDIIVVGKFLRPILFEEKELELLIKHLQQAAETTSENDSEAAATSTNNIEKEEQILLVVFLQAMNVMRHEHIRKRFLASIVNAHTFYQQALHVCLKFGFLKHVDATPQRERRLTQTIDYIRLIYDFHSLKLAQKIRMTQFHDVYDALLGIATSAHIQPDLPFSVLNISMLSDIKQRWKNLYQKLKIHNSSFFRHCFIRIDAEAAQLSDFKWVFLVYKLSTVDHMSFGHDFSRFWAEQEQRFINRFDDLTMIQRKSLLYSMGKNHVLTANTSEIAEKLLASLPKNREEPNYLEYVGNVIHFSSGNLVIGKDRIETLLPFLSEVLSDSRYESAEKADFIVQLASQFYRLGIYDNEFWKWFFKYESEILKRDQGAFICNLMIQSAPSLLDNSVRAQKKLKDQIEGLKKRFIALPNYNQIVDIQLKKSTLQRQSLYEMRFGNYLNSFGKPFTKEQIFENIISVDFYIPEEKIAIEIDGHSHYHLALDGTYRMNLNSLFKIKFLNSIGISSIHLGVFNLQKPEGQVSVLREFLDQYNAIKLKRQQEQSKQATS